MLQIYALSVAINVIMGIVIMLDRKHEESDDGDASIFQGTTFTLTITILAGVIAISTLMAPYKMVVDSFSFSALPIFGDLLPALATLLGFLVFLSKFLKNNYSQVYAKHNFFILIEKSEFYIAIVCITFAVLHFFFPTALFL